MARTALVTGGASGLRASGLRASGLGAASAARLRAGGRATC
jgi:hypothetical protein